MSIEQASNNFAKAVLELAAAIAESATTAKPKKERAPKEEKTEAAAKSEPAPPAGPSAKEVADAVLGLASVKGRDAAVGVLAKFNAQKVSELKPASYADVLNAVKEVLTGPANDSLV
jgi:hypothetical protein